MDNLQDLISSLQEGDADTLLAVSPETVVVQDQRLGRLEGKAGVARWVRATATWLNGLSAAPKELAFLVTPTRMVHELSFAIRVGSEVVDLPYVLVADRSASGIVEYRTYHSTWPYTGEHVFRPPPLVGRNHEEVPEIFRWYVDRVSVADVEAVLARFTEDGYVREPSGERWKHQGSAARAKFYGHLVTAPRASFELMTSTVVGATIAVEYGFSYGDVPMVGGICVMETRGGRIAAVRITDDVGA